jgi:hypothetical protein
VRRCCHCSAALWVERRVDGQYAAQGFPIAGWQAMKSQWESWEPRTAVGWQEPDVINDILACAGREFTRYTPTDRSTRDFVELVDPAISVVVATAELAAYHPSLNPLAERLHPMHPLSDEAFYEAGKLLAQAIWILIALLMPKLWRDPRSDAHRWLPLHRGDRTHLKRLASTQRHMSEPDYPGRRSFASESLGWFAGAAAAADRELVESWDRILARAEDLVWEQREASIY